jgi:hypothetical protein
MRGDREDARCGSRAESLLVLVDVHPGGEGEHELREVDRAVRIPVLQTKSRQARQMVRLTVALMRERTRLVTSTGGDST